MRDMRLSALTASATRCAADECGDGGQAQSDDGEREDGRVFTGMLGVERHLAVFQAAEERGDTKEEQRVADDDACDRAEHDLRPFGRGEGQQDVERDEEFGDVTERGVQERRR